MIPFDAEDLNKNWINYASVRLNLILQEFQKMNIRIGFPIRMVEAMSPAVLPVNPFQMANNLAARQVGFHAGYFTVESRKKLEIKTDITPSDIIYMIVNAEIDSEVFGLFIMDIASVRSSNSKSALAAGFTVGTRMRVWKGIVNKKQEQRNKKIQIRKMLQIVLGTEDYPKNLNLKDIHNIFSSSSIEKSDEDESDQNPTLSLSSTLYLGDSDIKSKLLSLFWMISTNLFWNSVKKEF